MHTLPHLLPELIISKKFPRLVSRCVKITAALLFTLPLLGYCNVNGTATIELIGEVKNRTCQFDKTTYSVELPPVASGAFNHAEVIGRGAFSVTLTCGDAVTLIDLVASGAADDNNPDLFKNTGSAKNVGLRLFDNEDRVLTPSGLEPVTVTPEAQRINYNFSAAYAATGAGKVAPGNFISAVDLTINYR